ncbi:MAG: hypothetical protein RL641_364 [Candidatus Parcubacteria bacterium]|jgi:nitrosocyanin
MNKAVSIIVILAVALAGVWLLMKNRPAGSGVPQEQNEVMPDDLSMGMATPEDGISDDMVNITTDANVTTGATGTVATTTTATTTTANVKSFTVDASNFKFAPTTMTVNKGDTVRITLTNGQGNHDFKIDSFNVHTKLLTTGGTDTVEFIADKAGSFEYYCTVGSHRAMGMKGTLIVK